MVYTKYIGSNIQPYIPLVILVVIIIINLIYIATKQGHNSPTAFNSPLSNTSKNPFLHTYFPTIILIVVIIFGLLVMFSILDINFDKKLHEKVSKIVTLNAKI